MREEVKDNNGFIIGYIEKVGGGRTNAYDSTGCMLGYSDSSGTFTAGGTKKYGSDCAGMLIKG